MKHLNKQTPKGSKHANKQTKRTCEQTYKHRERERERERVLKDKCRFGFVYRISIELNYKQHTYQQTKLLK